MPLPRRAVLLGSLALAGCAALPPSPQGETRPITLTDAFLGKSTGRGVFRNTLTGATRGFRVDLHGRLRGDVLTVAEDFAYDDGQRDRLTWVFTRTEGGRWSGKREDTVGYAEVVELQGEVRLRYLADFRSPGRVMRLGFADVIYRRADGVIVNEGVVTKAGIPVGTVLLEIRRE